MPSEKRQPTHDDFLRCAEVAHEFNEVLALCELGPLLEAESDHGYLCQLGVWYWQLGHKCLASACYRRSLDLEPEGPTYFNLAICLDDIASELEGDSEMIAGARKQYRQEAIEAIRRCYSATSSSEERSSIQAMLVQNGKDYLAKAGARETT